MAVDDFNVVTREIDIDSESSVSITASQSAEPAAQVRFGRYAMLEELGSGAMGRVWRAYDPKLEREVALKVLHSNVLDSEAQARLVREARAMAKLSHPHVVLVYDVDDSRSGVMLVMECIRGPTLREWLKQEERSWQECMARFAEAGRGLVAAHAVGLLHRDFKPSNVLIAEGDVAKVTDFGLAKLGHEGDSGGATLAGGGPKDSLRGTLTAHNVIMGTPRYMAPEQHRGDSLGPQVDQYAFCVSLWEALTRSPPFVGDYAELEASKHKGPPQWPEELVVPRRVVEALRRGLAVEAADRWPSMADLLEVLEDDGRPRRRGWMMGGGSLGLGALLAMGWVQATSEQCTGASVQLEKAWGEGRRRGVEAAVLGTKASFAADTWERLEVELDRYASEWQRMYTDACEATVVRKEQSEAMMDLRIACMQRSRQELDAVVEVLEKADTGVVQEALRLVDGLEPLAGCADLEALQSGVQPPRVEDAEGVKAVRERLARAKAQYHAGRAIEAKRSVEEAELAAIDIEYEPLKSELALLRGDILDALAEYAAAEEAYRTVLRLGMGSGQKPFVRSAVIALIDNVGRSQARPNEGLSFVDIAHGLTDDEPKAVAELHRGIGALYFFQGQYEEAKSECLKVVTLNEEIFGAHDRRTLAAYTNLASSLEELGHLQEAEQVLRKTLDLSMDVLGARHPLVAQMHTNLGTVKLRQGEYEEAESEYRKALAIWIDAFGPDNVTVGLAHLNIGSSIASPQRYAELEAEYYEALRIWEQQLAADHPNLAAVHNNIGRAREEQGDYINAEREYRKALQIWSATNDEDHPNVAMARSNIGSALMEQGKYGEALEYYHRALEIREKTLGPDHPAVYAVHLNMAILAIREQRYDAAKATIIDIIPKMEKTLGSKHPDIAMGYGRLAEICSLQRDHQQAEFYLRRALEHVEEDNMEQISFVRLKLAEQLLRGGKANDALSLAQQVWDGIQMQEVSEDARAETAFILAQGLWQSGGQRSRAREFAGLAARLYREQGDDEAVEVERWLQENQMRTR